MARFTRWLLTPLFLFLVVGKIYSQTSIEVTPEQGLRSALTFAASAGVDTIFLSVSGGVYAETDTFTYQISKPVVIMAKPGLEEKPILINSSDPGTKNILELFRVSDDLTLDGVILDGGHPQSTNGRKYGIRVGPNFVTGAPAKNGLNLTIKNCDFRNFYEGGFGQGHGVYFLKDVVAGTVLIENCTFKNTGYEAIRMTETEKYAVTKCLDTLIVRNCTFENIAAECVRFYSDLLDETEDAYVLIEHLTINKCNTRTFFIKNNENTIVRNIIITNDFDGSTISGESRTDYVMDVQDSGSVVSNIDTMNITHALDPSAKLIKATKGGTVDSVTIYGFDPMYEDAEASNYTLLAGSPAYGKGHDGSALGDLRWATNEPVSVREEKTGIAESYELHQNYPNPFNPATIINYEIPKAGFVNITVYNLIGEKVETLVNEFKNAGKYKLNFNAENLRSGVYFYTIKADNFISTRKMVLIR